MSAWQCTAPQPGSVPGCDPAHRADLPLLTTPQRAPPSLLGSPHHARVELAKDLATLAYCGVCSITSPPLNTGSGALHPDSCTRLYSSIHITWQRPPTEVRRGLWVRRGARDGCRGGRRARGGRGPPTPPLDRGRHLPAARHAWASSSCCSNRIWNFPVVCSSEGMRCVNIKSPEGWRWVLGELDLGWRARQPA